MYVSYKKVSPTDQYILLTFLPFNKVQVDEYIPLYGVKV